jgi:hypothetical protein
MAEIKHSDAVVAMMRRRLLHAWCLKERPDHKDARAALVAVVDALVADGWRKVGDAPYEVIRFEGTLTDEDAERLRTLWQREIRAGSLAYPVPVTRLPVTRTPWWRRVLRWLRGADGD